ncbi:MAG: PA14 domain-containing protein [Anaerolineae bacterium]
MMLTNLKYVFRWGVGLMALALLTVLAPTVRASAPLAPARDIVSGCTGQYYNNMTLAGSPVLTRTDASVNFYWPEGTSPGPGVATSGYSVAWTCTLNAPTAGTYTVNILTDDGMNILVDGNLILWAWYDQGPSSYSNSGYLTAGTHTMRVEYYNNTNGGTAQVSTNLTSIGGSTPVPTTPSTTGGYLANCTGQYYNNTTFAGSPVLTRTDTSLNFYWPTGTSPGSGINTTNYGVRWTCPVSVSTAGNYTISILTDDGMNVWVDGTLVIGAWINQPPTAYSTTLYVGTGSHTIKVEYYNAANGGTAQVSTTLTSGGGGGSTPVPVSSGYLTNCTGQYYNNTTLAGSPVLTRTDASINFYWPEGTSPGAGVATSYYSVAWTCSVNVTTAGNYTVSMTTDDGMNILVDGSLVIWAWYDQGPSTYTHTGYLTAGTHTVRVEYYNATNGGTAKVSLQ